MRIRKYWHLPPPPPLSASPLAVPVAAPPDLLTSTPLHPTEPASRPSSDLQLGKVTSFNGCDHPNHSTEANQNPQTGAGEEEESSQSTTEDKRFSTPTNQSVGRYNPTAETTSLASSVSSSLSHSVAVIGGWCKEEKAIPLKKRRSILMMMTSMLNDETSMEENEIEEKKDSGNGDEGMKSMKMEEEGLRCSRANGRQWRCGQTSAKGFTQCQYHLNQARTRYNRFMVNRRQNLMMRRDIPAAVVKRKNLRTSSYFEEDDEDEDEDDDDEGFEVGKMRKKFGFVKARSISSLLDQTVPLLP